MNMNRLALISGVLVILAAAAYGINRWMGESGATGRVGKSIMPAIDMAEAATIEIVSSDGKVTLKSDDGANWTVAEQGGFPVSPKKLNGLLIKLTQGKIAHQVTSKQEKLEGLGLLTAQENGDKREKEKTGTEIRILDKQGGPLFEVMIGKERSGESMTTFGGTYIRYPEETKAYLISDSAVFGTEPKDWIDTVVIAEEADKTLQSIRIEKPGQPALVLTRDKPEADWSVSGIPADRLNKEEAKSMASQLAGLDIFKIAPEGSRDADLGRGKVGTVRFTYFDKRAFTLQVGTEKAKDDFRYLTVQAELPEDVQDDALKQKVAAFNTRFKGRLMAVYDWDGGRLLRERKDFLAKQDK